MHANPIIVNLEQQLITLRHPAGKLQTSLGTIETEKEMRIFLHRTEDRTELYKVETEGATTITFVDQEKQLSHSLFAMGRSK